MPKSSVFHLKLLGLVIGVSLIVSACSQSTDPLSVEGSAVEASTPPPPLPEGQQTVSFERPVSASTSTGGADDGSAPFYWGIKPGDPLPIMWHDLMPEGAEEELIRQQEEFYRMLEQRYMANTTRLADAANALDSIEEGSELDYMPQFGTFDIVEDLNGELVRIPGYIVPFDFNPQRRHEAFLFVPYMGACIHTPPPPPNQIIYVRADPSVQVKDIWQPYWIEGELKGEEVLNETGDAAYSLTLQTLELYNPF
ncbi:MAG: DUF3299 domain-containing protein [Pseudomonadota bacterium]